MALLKDEPERVSTLRPVRQVAELMDVGVAAVQQGRLADAAVALRGAGERLQPLRSAWPGDPVLARLHGTSLGFLGSTLRGLKRPREALESHRASVAAYESLDAPEAPNLHNLACGYAMVSALDDRASPDDRERLQARAVGCLRRAIEADPDRYRSLISEDRDLDPLRGRADFRDLMVDAGFPRDPFARPSSPPPSASGAVCPEIRGRNRGEAIEHGRGTSPVRFRVFRVFRG